MPAPTTSIFLNSTTPAAPSGDQNVKPQSDGATPQQSISFYPQVATTSLRGTVKPDGTTITIASDGTITAASVSGGATQAGVQEESYVYGADTGTANTYKVSLTPTPTLGAGSIVVFKSAHANTGASTLALNGGSAKSIKKQGSTALASGDIASGQIIVVVYDGTNFQLIGSGSSGMTNPMTTEGDLIVGGSSGTPGRLAAGTSGYVLTANGAGEAPSYQAASGGGIPWLTITNPASLSMTWLNQGSAASETVGTASRTIWDIGNGGNLGYRGRQKAAGTPPFSVTAGLSAAQYVGTASQGQLCAGIYVSDGTKMVVLYLYITEDGEAFFVDYTTSTAFSSEPLGPIYPFDIGSECFLKIYDDGANLSFYVGQDGLNFYHIGSLARLSYLSAVTYYGYTCLGLGLGIESSVTLFSWTEGTS